MAQQPGGLPVLERPLPEAKDPKMQELRKEAENLLNNIRRLETATKHKPNQDDEVEYLEWIDDMDLLEHAKLQLAVKQQDLYVQAAKYEPPNQVRSDQLKIDLDHAVARLKLYQTKKEHPEDIKAIQSLEKEIQRLVKQTTLLMEGDPLKG